MAVFGRVLTAMITPFGEDGEIDHERTWNLARHLVAQGSDGLVVTGTTGESPTLSEDEKVATYRTVVEAVAGKKTKVIAGTGTYNTAESVHLSQRAAAAGCDGILAVTPYYNRPSQEGLVAHFRAIADATDLPVLLYNIPGRTARLIEIETLKKLSDHPRIVAVKDAVMDIDFTSRTCAEVPELEVYSGQDTYTWPMMAVGAVGVVSVISHLAGPAVAAMVKAAAGGALDQARDLHRRLLPLGLACFLEPNPAPVKAALNAIWEPVGQPRLPLVAASDSTVTAIKEALTHL
ncbi:MAG: 4-hydroxy-tetrahydrodipicolinate synthase [Acidimicrobiia bacterium]|nr:4-hydroxy-tetrahydrodipicolinate synthase [Acidimicrobiia bacterium]MDQ3500020.1 4-hydroxy-tetrahydrodipicolinate synthase [Actinomycetota bacterium]